LSRPDVLVAGRYRLVQQIAAGGMGSVWEAWDERLHRRVALKQLHPQPGLSPADAQLASDRAMREARITARLHHANAVPVYDVVDYEGLPCMIMQFLPSKSLQAVLTERGALSVAEVARIGSEVASALAAAHQVGIVHRDVKPGNVLIDEEGSAKLTDFGISHALGDASLTSTGMVTGTPAFLAPEVARGAESSAASDVFSLGSTLYAALEGTPPFGTSENPMAMLHRVASGNVIPPRRSGPLTPLLQHMLAFDPARRPPMTEVARTLAAGPVPQPYPVASAATQRMGTGPPAASPPVPPPSATVLLPAASGAPARAAAGPPRHRGRVTALIVAIILVVAALAVVLATQLAGGGSGGDGGQSVAAGSTPSSPRTTKSSSAAVSSSASSSPPATEAAAAPTPAQLTRAITDYYRLLPNHTDAAWLRLTAKYQAEHANGRKDYDDYWNQIRSVSTSKAMATGPRAVQATITYTYKDGRVVDERTDFQLVRSGGILKIDDTTVLSSITHRVSKGPKGPKGPTPPKDH
jgi:serine/threonine protein kinase